MSTIPASELAEALLADLRGSDYAVAVADDTTDAAVRWGADGLSSNGMARVRRLTAVVLHTDRLAIMSHAGVSDFAGVRQLAAAAKEAVASAEPRPRDFEPATVIDDHWRQAPPVHGLTPVAEFVSALALVQRRDRNRSWFGFAQQRTVTTVLATSTGARRRWVQPIAVLDLTLAGGDRSTWAGVRARRLNEIDVESEAERLRERLSYPRHLCEPPTGPVELLLDSSCVADLLVPLYRSAGAQAARQGISDFSDGAGGTRIGERLTTRPVNLRSDPATPGLECAPFTIARGDDGRASVLDNGIPLHPVEWIDGGVLKALIETGRSSFSDAGNRTALVDNLVLDGGSRGPAERPVDLQDLVARTELALLPTSLWYLREVGRRPLTLAGAARDDAHLVRDGRVVGQVAGFGVTVRPLDLLERIEDIGTSRPTLPREWGTEWVDVAMPPLRVSGVDITFGGSPSA